MVQHTLFLERKGLFQQLINRVGADLIQGHDIYRDAGLTSSNIDEANAKAHIPYCHDSSHL